VIDIFNAIALFTNFVIVPAIAYGSQIALGALGVTLIFGILRFANFAHGDLMAFGTAVTILLTWWLQSLGIGFGVLPTALLALPVGIAAAAGLTLATDRVVYRFYRNKRVAPVIMTMASVGVTFIYGGLVRILIGSDDQRFADGERFLISAAGFREMTGLAEGVAVKVTVLVTVVATVLAMGWLFWFLARTRTGKAMRAFSDNEDLALLSGINPERVVLFCWLLAAGLATLAGTLYGLDKSFKPFNYVQLLLPFFAAAMVGGIGNPLGAVVGGYLVAFSEVAITYPYKRVLEYLGFRPEGLVQLISVDYKYAVSFVILVLVLLLRPTGIFKGRVL